MKCVRDSPVGNQLNGGEGAVFFAIQIRALLPLQRTVDIQHLSVRREPV
jgi:Mg2+/citrate symporter